MKHAFVVNGRRVTCHSSGRSRDLPLVLLHGFCEDSSVWAPLLPMLRGLRLLRIDLPGFGGSDLPLAAGLEYHADAVCAVLNEFDVSRCVLVGHSMGGYTALETAARYGERLAGLGLVHSHPFGDNEQQRDNRRRGIEHLRAGKKDLYVAQLFPKLFAPTFQQAHPEVLETLIQRARRLEARGIEAALEGMMTRPNRSEVLRAVPYPVLFLLGDADELVPPAQGMEASLLPALADVHLLKGVGHMGMFESPEKTASTLRVFWEWCRKNTLLPTPAHS